MTALLTRLFGRLPIGWLQLTHNRTRFFAALAGVAFSNILIFMQLGFLGALLESVALPYRMMEADIVIQASDANTLQDGSPLPRQRMYEAMAVAGVADATAVYFNKLDWKQPDGTVRTLDVFGIDPARRVFLSPQINAARDALKLSDTALIDRRTRNVPKALFAELDRGVPFTFEANGQRTLTVVGTFEIGGGFSADGYLIVSDQTFLRLFRQRQPGAPNLVFLKLAPDASPGVVMERLRQAFSTYSDIVPRTLAAATARDQNFQTTQKPVGLIFGFGVFIGILVGIIIAYQVLSTDVADHLREYATFKAMGYGRRFFLGIVFEQALILAIFGFFPGIAISLGLYAVVAAATGLPIAMTTARVSIVLFGTLLMCAISGAIATRRLARANPADLF